MLGLYLVYGGVHESVRIRSSPEQRPVPAEIAPAEYRRNNWRLMRSSEKSPAINGLLRVRGEVIIRL